MNYTIHKRHHCEVFSQQWQLTLLSWGFCNVYSAVIFAQQILLIMSVTEGAEQVHCLCKCNVGFIHLTLKVSLVQHFTSWQNINPLPSWLSADLLKMRLATCLLTSGEHENSNTEHETGTYMIWVDSVNHCVTFEIAFVNKMIVSRDLCCG